MALLDAIPLTDKHNDHILDCLSGYNILFQADHLKCKPNQNGNKNVWVHCVAASAEKFGSCPLCIHYRRELNHYKTIT